MPSQLSVSSTWASAAAGSCLLVSLSGFFLDRVAKYNFTRVKSTSYPLVEDREEGEGANQQQGRAEKEVTAAGRTSDIHQQAADAGDAGADL